MLANWLDGLGYSGCFLTKVLIDFIFHTGDNVLLWLLVKRVFMQ